MDVDAVADLADRIGEGAQDAIARGITWCEQGGDRASALLDRLPETAAGLVGVTGSPGAGKSSLVSRLVTSYRSAGNRVGVVAVDPSSPISGGALLGDRVRLEGVSDDRDVFFRSLASRGAAGGLSHATRAAARVLAAGGFDPVLIETVGAGQAEVEVMRVASTVLVVLTPGAGDDVQALKAGIMEIADVFVLNKADRPGIGQLKSDVAALLHARDRTEWRPRVVEAVATRGEGVAELLGAIAEHREYLAQGDGRARATAASRAGAVRVARAAFEAALGRGGKAYLEALDRGEITEVEAGRALAREASRILMTATGRVDADAEADV